MSKQSSQFIRIAGIDGLEVLSMEDQQQEFPDHFHETYNFTWVTEGCEVIKMPHQTYYGPRDSIT
ncbi:MAG: hypothetical protein AAF570_16345, partial [Bacteroidota bacterium]